MGDVFVTKMAQPCSIGRLVKSLGKRPTSLNHLNPTAGIGVSTLSDGGRIFDHLTDRFFVQQSKQAL